MIEMTVVTSITKRHKGTVSGADLRIALGMPAHCRLFVEVPRGGDYSGQLLDLDDELVHVEWIEEVEDAIDPPPQAPQAMPVSELVPAVPDEDIPF